MIFPIESVSERLKNILSNLTVGLGPHLSMNISRCDSTLNGDLGLFISCAKKDYLSASNKSNETLHYELGKLEINKFPFSILGRSF